MQNKHQPNSNTVNAAPRAQHHNARDILMRIIAAILGGYFTANLAAVSISWILPGATSSKVMTALQLSFLLYAAIVIWVFAIKSAKQAWLGIALVSLISMALIAGLAVLKS